MPGLQGVRTGQSGQGAGHVACQVPAAFALLVLITLPFLPDFRSAPLWDELGAADYPSLRGTAARGRRHHRPALPPERVRRRTPARVRRADEMSLLSSSPSRTRVGTPMEAARSAAPTSFGVPAPSPLACRTTLAVAGHRYHLDQGGHSRTVLHDLSTCPFGLTVKHLATPATPPLAVMGEVRVVDRSGRGRGLRLTQAWPGARCPRFIRSWFAVGGRACGARWLRAASTADPLITGQSTRLRGRPGRARGGGSSCPRHEQPLAMINRSERLETRAW